MDYFDRFIDEPKPSWMSPFTPRNQHLDGVPWFGP